MKSMTGFGHASYRDKNVAIGVELRSVNHRFLKLTCNLPDYFSSSQDVLEDLLRRRLSRGSVNLSVSLEFTNGSHLLDAEALRRLYRRMSSLRSDLGIRGEVSMEALLETYWQGGGIRGAASAAARRHWGKVVSLVRQSIDGLMAMREMEGEHTRKDCLKRIRAIHKVVAQIARRVPASVRAQTEKMTNRVNDLLKGNRREVSKEEIAREVAIIADKCDVSEELSRLNSHILQMEKLLFSDGEIGRRIDFLLQEMNREATTISAKAADAEMIRSAIEIKAHLEKMKEQVENVE